MSSVAGAYPFGLSTWDGWNPNRWFVTYINVIQTKTANPDLVFAVWYVYFNISLPAFFVLTQNYVYSRWLTGVG